MVKNYIVYVHGYPRSEDPNAPLGVYGTAYEFVERLQAENLVEAITLAVQNVVNKKDRLIFAAATRAEQID